MPTIICPNCHENCETPATACPHCAAPLGAAGPPEALREEALRDTPRSVGTIGHQRGSRADSLLVEDW